MEKNKTLLIVDPQFDFISGSLAVPGANKAMSNLTSWMQQQIDNINSVVVTTDQHPLNHCSFKVHGGPWPMHCVKYTKGAAIDEHVLIKLIQFASKGVLFEVIEKGTKQDLEEYSAFKKNIPEKLQKAQIIYIAGIAGDYCVFESISDLVALGLKDKLVVLTKAIASIDGGEKLQNYLNTQGIKQL